MQLTGVNDKGDPVKASIADFAGKMKKNTESMQMGTSPTHFVYTDRGNGNKREVDLKEIAQAAGIKNVQFKFDPKEAKRSGMFEPRDIDQGVAYNLERIKNDDHKLKYLEEKGYSNVVRDGDDFYGYENGKIFPINNKEGIDLSDFTRLGASAGRDIGATAAATAVIGAGAVAAAPSGGSSVAAAAGYAGVAGAAGGVAGEGLQRMGDKFFGADAAKYNAQLSGSEEAAEAGKAALMGGVAGVAQPLMAAGGAKATEGLVAPALRKLGGEWGATKAAKMEAGALMTRLPQGAMQKFASEEEMAAMAALKDGLGMAGRGELNNEGLRQVTSESRDMIARGSAKKPLDEAEEHFVQAGMRKQFQSDTLEAAKKAETEKMTNEAQEGVAKKAQTELVEHYKMQAQDAYPKNKKELETIFDPKTSLDDSQAAQNKIVGEQLHGFSSRTKIKVEYETGSQKPVGLENESFQKFVDGSIDNVFKGSDDFLMSLRTKEQFLDKTPTELLRGDTTKGLTGSLGDIEPEVYNGKAREIVQDVIAEINGIGTTGNNATLRRTINRFHEMTTNLADETRLDYRTRKAISDASAAVQNFETGSTTAPDMVRAFYTGKNKLVEVKGILSSNRGAHNDDVFTNVVGGINELSRSTYDPDGYGVRQLNEAIHLDHMLTNGLEAGSPTVHMLTSSSRQHMNVLSFIRNYEHIGKKVIPTPDSKQGRANKFGAAVAGGVISKISGGSFLDGAAAGYATGSFLPAKGQAIISGAKKVAEKVGSASAALSSTASAVNRAVGTPARTYGVLQAEESYVPKHAHDEKTNNKEKKKK